MNGASVVELFQFAPAPSQFPIVYSVKHFKKINSTLKSWLEPPVFSGSMSKRSAPAKEIGSGRHHLHNTLWGYTFVYEWGQQTIEVICELVFIHYHLQIKKMYTSFITVPGVDNLWCGSSVCDEKDAANSPGGLS